MLRHQRPTRYRKSPQKSINAGTPNSAPVFMGILWQVGPLPRFIPPIVVRMAMDPND